MLEGIWSVTRWKEVLEVGATIAALLFTGIALHVDARVRRAQTLIEITKQHRELWMYFDEHPELAGLLDPKRDLNSHPLSRPELRFANFLFLHFRATYGAKTARIHTLPEEVGDDWRWIFSHPAVLAAWEQVKPFHDRQFVSLVESYRERAKSTALEYPASPGRESRGES